jgi:dTDP-glucose 4,6-dehydratase
VDASKIKKELGWTPTQDFDALLTQTVEWYVKKYKS